jgi:pyrimidine-nucleoside phosphorylase
MNPSEIIQKKRDGHELSTHEIDSFIHGLQNGNVADYQASAWLMAIYFQGMSPAETAALTESMLNSGKRIDLSDIPGPKVDKHSTGGVGDKVSLILAPLAAACGLVVPMMAGRGLGHSGGTLDKLEAISGFRVNLSEAEYKRILKEIGCAIIGQSKDIVPADKKLYAIRDVTGTVECIPLIVGSILSKKLAEGTEGLILDVKVGNGAFMQTKTQARQLAQALIRVARKTGMNCRAVLTDMNQPLGYSAGNSLEVIESIELLQYGKCKRPDLSCTDLKEVTLHLCARMLETGGLVKNLTEGRKRAQEKLADGTAWKIFQEMVSAQGGDLKNILEPETLPLAPQKIEFRAPKRGFISKMETTGIGQLVLEMGGGRKKSSDTIDHGVGLLFHKKLGASVRPGDLVVTAYAKEDANSEELIASLSQKISISQTRKPLPKLIVDTIE